MHENEHGSVSRKSLILVHRQNRNGKYLWNMMYVCNSYELKVSGFKETGNDNCCGAHI